MKDNPEKQDELQRMLALKRSETPPPPFFKSFSKEVIERIHNPEFGEQQTLVQRFRGMFSSRPAQVVVLGLVVLGCLISGILASRDAVPPKSASTPDGMGSKFQADSGANALPSLDQPAVITDGVPSQNRHPDAAAISQSPTSSLPRSPIR